MARYQIVHTTEYLYDEAASLCYNETRMLPRAVSGPQFQQTVLESQLSVQPLWDDSRERTDYFGNRVLYYTIRQPHTAMTMTVTSQVEITPGSLGKPESQGLSPTRKNGSRSARTKPLAGLPHSMSWEEAAARLLTESSPDILAAREFALGSSLAPILPAPARFARSSFPAGRPVVAAVADLMTRIYTGFDFKPGVTNISTPIDQVLRSRAGVCQDFAHLMLGCLRSLGLAARYVSGYIETLPPPGQEKLQGSDASHAWCALFVPGLGWLDFDPTNNILPHDQHIVLGWGRDFGDVTPLKGVFFGEGEHELRVSVDVTRLAADKEEKAKEEAP